MGIFNISVQDINTFAQYLEETEHSRATIEKYMRVLNSFCCYLPHDQGVTKELVVAYKNQLVEQYSISSVNAALAAVNSLVTFLGRPDLRVRALKRQRRIFCAKSRDLTREEYLRLLKTARQQGCCRLMLVMETICATGIRVSELEYVTVEAAQSGRTDVTCKGKLRTIFIPRPLGNKLLTYAREHGVKNGYIFRTKTGKRLDRSNIWRDMKTLCKSAGVDPEKVFPHNLRHLFAKTFYAVEKNLARLADLLGHSSVETTRIYIMESGEEHARQMAQLGLVV